MIALSGTIVPSPPNARFGAAGAAPPSVFVPASFESCESAMLFVLFWPGSVSRSVDCNIVNGVVGRLPTERFRHGGRPLDTMLRTAWTIASCRPKSGSLREDKCGNSKVIWNGSQWLLRALSIPEWLYLGSAGAPLRRKSFTTETRRFGFYRVFSVIAVISVVDFHPYGWAADRRDDFRRLLRNPAAELCARGSGLGPSRSND